MWADLIEFFQTLAVALEPFTNATRLALLFCGSGLVLIAGYLLRQIRILEREKRDLERDLQRRDEVLEGTRAHLAAVEGEKAEVEARAARLAELFNDEKENIWTRDPVQPPARYAQRLANSIPIVMLANLKGGVGKTTLAANLAGYFDRRGERVLLIDLDYQGSLTATATPEIPAMAPYPAASALLELGEVRTDKLHGTTTDSRVVGCSAFFTNLETRLMLKWAAGEFDDDIRYRIAEALLSDQVQNSYDRVIIDSPPRMTTGFVNGLCAATHLVIPTKLDRLSIEAVESFLISLNELKPALLPGLASFRVVAMQKTNAGASTEVETQAISLIYDILEFKGHMRAQFLDGAMVPTRADFGRAAGSSIAYFQYPTVARVIDPVGDAIGKFAPSRLRVAA